jgi:integrase/recombinase XerD
MFLSKVGKIYHIYFTNPNTGKRTKISTKEKTKRNALRYLYNFGNKQRPKNVKKSLVEFKLEMLQYAKIHYAKSTIDLFKRSLDNLIAINGNIMTNYLQNLHIEKYKSERLLAGASRTTVNMEFRALRSMFNTGITLRLIEGNPCVGVKKLSVPEKEILAFTEKEIEEILSQIQEQPLRSIVQTALYTGCRINEILNLQWRDIDLENRVLTILNKPNFQTKTGRIRRLPISEKLFLIFSNLPNQENMNYVFVNAATGKLNKNHISKLFKKYLRTLRFNERYHFHCLRHTFITQLARKGVNIYNIKYLAGHHDIKTTELYMHQFTEDLKNAVNLI